MAKVTSQGWESESFDTILTDTAAKAKLALGATLTTTPESVFGQLSNILCASIKDLNDLGQAVTDTQNRHTATGIYLNYLAALVGLTRQESQGAQGLVHFTGKVSTNIIVNTACKDTAGQVILSKTAHTLNRANCYSSTFSVSTLTPATNYTIVVEGVSITINSATSTTNVEVLNLLSAAINAGTSQVSTVDTTKETLTVTYQNYNNLLTTTNTVNLNLDTVGSLVSCETAKKGTVSVYANTCTTLVTPNLGLSAVDNIVAFTSGRDLETDVELRLRMAGREQSTGTATKPAIEASLTEIKGVTSALLVVNDTLVDNTTTGVSAKSFKSFVAGGDENSIAEVLWKTKALFGTSQGDITKTITDRNGDTQGVSFSRPTTKYAWVRVTYAINSEETFPSDGETSMTAAVVAKGKAGYQGEDLTPTKFYGALYETTGVYISNVEVAITTTAGGTPDYTLANLVTPANISVPKTEFLEFDITRVNVTT